MQCRTRSYAFGFMLIAVLSVVVQGQMMESFEDVAIGHMPPIGWQKWEEAGGRGWSNSWAGRQPMPGWMSGTNDVPPDPDAGTRMAYVTYTHGGSKTNDLWLISPTLKGVVATSTVSFWYRNSFSNFADSLRLMVSTNPEAARKSDFSINAWQQDFPRGWPHYTGVRKDFDNWSNISVNVGALVPAGSDVRIAFQEYWYNNWYDVAAIELDVIRSDLWSAPYITTLAVRATSPTSVEVDYDGFHGYPAGEIGVCYGAGPNPDLVKYNFATGSNGAHTVTFSNLSARKHYYFRSYVKHKEDTYYGNDICLYPGESEGEGYLFESFEDTPIALMPTAGWRKWEEAGGRGWSNSWAGRQPIPGWMSGTNSTPPDPEAGTRMAYVTYTHGGSKTNDLWLITPTIKNVRSTDQLSFWYRSCFSNFADSIRVHISTKTNAYRKSDFSIQAFTHTYPRGWPNNCGPGVKCDFPPWTNFIVDIGSHVPPGSDIRLGFQEYYFNNWYDVRANEMDVIRMGSRPRYALQFDGTDDRVVLPPTPDKTQYTIEAWVKLLGPGPMSIVMRSDTNPLAFHSHQLRITPAGVFEHYLNDGAGKTVTGTTTVDTGQWYHVAGTASNSGNMRLYVNGVEEGTPKTIGSLWSGGDRYHIGAASAAHTHFDGQIDEVRVWADERSVDEIRDTMNVYVRGVEPGLESCYRFDRTFETDVEDSSEPAYSTYFGPATESDQWAVEDGWHFNGVDDAVTLSETNGPPDYTIEAWVRPSVIGQRNIIVHTDTNPLTSYNHQLRMNAAGQFEFYNYDGVTRTVTGTTTASNTWYHIAGSAQNGGTMTLYVNGAAEGSAPAGNTMWGTYSNYMVGTRTGGGFWWFAGEIRGVSITNRVKLATEFSSAINNATNTAGSPQWVPAETPLGDYIAAEQWHNRGIWEKGPSSSSPRGLDTSSGIAGITNFVVFGDDNGTGQTHTLIPATAAVRLSRIWHADVHGQHTETVQLTFNPTNAGTTDLFFPDTNSYTLLRRDGTSGSFTTLLSHASSAATGYVTFASTPVTEGYYTLAIEDSVPPTILGCPSDINTTNTPGSCDALVIWNAITATDNVNLVSFTNDYSSGDTFPVGTTLVHFVAEDWVANTSTCSFAVIVADVEPPLLTGPADTNEAVNTSCQFVLPDYSNRVVVTDNCSTSFTLTQVPAPATTISGAGTPQTVTLWTTDTAGNSNSCSFDVTLVDSTPPTVSCPGDQFMFVNASCQVSLPDYRGMVTVSDDCDASPTLTQSPIPGTSVSGAGTVVTVTMTAVDASANTGTCSFTATAADNSNPTITCPGNQMIFLNAACQAALPDYRALATAADNCDASPTVTQTPAAGTTVSNAGTVIGVVLTAIDGSGNSDSCGFNVVLADMTPPVIPCPGNTNEAVDVNCEFLLRDYRSLAIVSDGCDESPTLTQSPPAGTTLTNAGTVQLVTLLAMDGSGNSTSCTFDVTLIDTITPTISDCPAHISTTNITGSCGASVSWIAPTASDNCGVASFTNDYNPGDIFPVGTTIVHYVASDNSTAATCTFEVVVADVEKPFISGCPANINTTNTPGSCDAIVTWVAPIAADNCSVASFTNTHNPSDAFNVGTTRVVYVAADTPGLAVTCAFDVVVADVEDPAISGCPSEINTTNTPGSCDAVGTWVAPTASDNCDVISYTNDFDPGDTFNVGTTRVHYVALDLVGHSVTCAFDIVVADVENPAISGCLGTINTTNTPGSCDIAVTWAAPTASDNCSVTSFTNDFDPGDTFSVGTTRVHYVAADLAAHSVTCAFDVVVADAEEPVISGCPTDINTTNTPGSCTAVITWTAPTASDNCPGLSFTNSHAPGDTFSVGTTLVAYVATDVVGHSITCAFDVVVADVESPAISGCPSDINTTNTPGSCDATVTWAAPTASDNCSVASFTNTHNPGDTFSVGTTRVVYVAADIPGLAVTCAFDVVVADIEDPAISGCPSDISTTNTPGSCDAVVTWVAPTANDNCGVASFTNTHNPGDTFNVGTTRVVYVAADTPGLAVTCAFDVVVADVEDPVISGCPADINTTNTPGSCDASVAWVAPTASDNCSVVSYTNDFDPGDTFSVGTTTVHYVALDLAGHSVICAFDIVVADVEDPTITCPSDISTTNDPGTCGAVVNYSAPTIGDNCPGAALTQIQGMVSGATFPVGETTNRFRVTDVAANTAECEFTVTVTDPEPPVISGCPSNITVIPPPGVFSDTATWTAPSAADNCSVDHFTSTHNPGDTFAAGVTPVAYEAVDSGANTSICTFTVSVEPQVEMRVIGFPSEHGTPQPFGYGTNLLAWNQIYTNTVPLIADESNGTHYAHSGMGIGSIMPITNGPGYVVFQATTNGLIQWLWRTEHYLSITSLSGSVLGGTQGWHNEGRIYDLAPSNSTVNYIFDHWLTNGFLAHSNVPLTVVMDMPQNVEAFFRALFIDVTDDTTATFIDWYLNMMTGTMLGDLELCNKTNSQKVLTQPFWYVAESNATVYLMNVDGTESNSGLPYVDLTAEVLAALPSVGNGDLILDRGECVVVSDIEFYSRTRQPPEGYLYAIWADPPGDGWTYDEAKADTDSDGIINAWEDAHALDKNDPLDGADDADEDGASNLHEFRADTDPQDISSYLHVGILHEVDGTLKLEWIGGTDVTQYLEQAHSPAGPWMCILTNIPPTEITNRVERDDGPEHAGYYRIRIDQ